MPQPLDIAITPLTPLWTGGVDGTCDQLHISGLMGSLRYWYEAIVRGAGGYACDPSEGTGCVYDPKLQERSLCAACYLFGTTGWARLFRLSAVENNSPHTIRAEEPLHFQSLTAMNRKWLKDVFEAVKDKKPTRSLVDSQYAIYPASLRLVHRWRQVEAEYTASQVAALYWFLAHYAGIGAKQQFGFGQFALEQPTPDKHSWRDGLAALVQKIGMCHPPKDMPTAETREGIDLTPPSLADFFWTEATVTESQVRGRNVLGQIAHADAYIASAFDIRYKANERVGFRAWLAKNRNQRDERKLIWSDDVLRAFLGASTRKGEPDLSDNERTASRLFVSMPHRQGPSLRLRLYGFALPHLETPDGKLTAQKAAALCEEYLASLPATNIASRLGSDLLKEARA